MSDEIRAEGISKSLSESLSPRRLFPMQIGNAIVYIEQTGEPATLETDDRIRPVAPPGSQEAFESAGQILHECVRVLGERIGTLAEKTRPQQISVEFSLSFEVKGKAAVIPVFITGEATTQTGLKVTAVWDRHEAEES